MLGKLGEKYWANLGRNCRYHPQADVEPAEESPFGFCQAPTLWKGPESDRLSVILTPLEDQVQKVTTAGGGLTSEIWKT